MYAYNLLKSLRLRNCVVLGIAFCMLLTICIPIGSAAPVKQKQKVQTIELFIGQSEIVNAPWATSRVSVTDPKIADVQVLTPKQVLLQGKQAGVTDLILWSSSEQIWRARVIVSVDLAALEEQLKKLFPLAKLKLLAMKNTVLISGMLRTISDVSSLHRFMDATGITWVDMTSVAGLQQVMLKVRIAEVSRVAIRAFGINFFNTGNRFFGGSVVGSSSGGPLNPVSIGVPEGAAAGPSVPFAFTSDVGISPSVTMFAGFPNSDLMFFIQALKENQYLRILAEPTLVTLSGKEASFLAGGEFPVPVVQGTDTGGGASVTIEYREFGVQLLFRPIVMGNGRLQLYVAPEVSELSDRGAIETQGFRVPSVEVRRAATTLELNDGQTFAMAGLIRRVTSARSSRVPGLGDIPILGALFRSTRYEKGETELVILVTARLVEPISPKADAPVPGDLHIEPDDWEFYLSGRIEGMQPKLAPPDLIWMREKGLHRLKGPGAWVNYGQERVPSRGTLQAAPNTVSQPPQTMPLKKDMPTTVKPVDKPQAKGAEMTPIKPADKSQVKRVGKKRLSEVLPDKQVAVRPEKTAKNN